MSISLGQMKIHSTVPSIPFLFNQKFLRLTVVHLKLMNGKMWPSFLLTLLKRTHNFVSVSPHRLEA